jgi:transcriptional regulator with XRE-family HTH domain
MDSLRERRERLGYTQKVLADACGIHFSHICHIERGNADPSLAVFVKLIEQLDVSPAKLLDMLKRRSRKSVAASVTDIQKERERRKRR